jgi:beta-galactosidase
MKFPSAPLLLLLACAAFSSLRGEDISSSGWRLWPDQQAAWKDDTLYLPADVKLGSLPVNPPTGGWAALSDQQGMAVTLPSTVEEHYWGKFGTRPYKPHPSKNGDDAAFENGNYLGVSWWWRTIHIPDFKPGQRVVVSFRGARLRSEVYCNGKLCSYSIMTELPFQADLTDAVKPGQDAQLAVRITNPGGNLDWVDFASSRIDWGKYTLPPSHGFGGLDSDIQLQVRDDASITDVASINKPDLHQVHLQADVTSVAQPYSGPVHFQINRNGQSVWTGAVPVSLAAGETKTVSVEATVPSAEPWDLQHPNLYQAHAELDGLADSGRDVNFGFRYFTAEGIGSDDAKLTLNGKRSVLISAISWGYWGRNGLWPDQEMAQREVSAAKQLGLNCLQFHRNVGKPAVFDEQDRVGLLRVEEPGAGKFIIGTKFTKGPWGPNGEFQPVKGDGTDCLDPDKGYVLPDKVDTTGNGPGGDPQVFWEKYEQEKILEMVKRDRSHPSLILYNIQNEASTLDFNNPRIFRVFRLMHALDPSRLITFCSGAPSGSQVLMLPYSDDISYSTKDLPFAGWRDVHTCGGPINYTDTLYQDPDKFGQKQPAGAAKEICVWGEMLGSGSADDYDKIVHSFDAQHPTGYELDDMKRILAGYHDFLDKYGFRKAFPTDSSLFQAIGYRTYYFWQRVLEQSRADNANDGLVVSGWESTTIDNHSGIVDNHRFFKGDPRVMAKACAPEVLFLQPRHMIVAKGDKDLVDVFLLNELNRHGPQTLKFTAKSPDGSVAFTTEQAVNATGGDTYGQLLAAAIEVPANTAGMLNLQASLTPQDAADGVLLGNDQIEVIDVPGAPISQKIAVAESDHEVTDTLTNIFHATPVAYEGAATAGPLDAIVIATKSSKGDLDAKAQPSSNAGSQKAQVSRALMDDALARVYNDGTRLVLWSDTDASAAAFCKELARMNVVTYGGQVGNRGAPWFGNWFFTRKHWLLDGLPSDCAVDWRYGIAAFGGPDWQHEVPKGNHTEGQLLDAPGMEVAVGYGADHNPKVGVSGCVIPYGKGQIVFYSLPDLVTGLKPGNFAIGDVIAGRLLGNALRPVGAPSSGGPDFTPQIAGP